jgi:ATP-dependent helicase/DNAse subunit B
MNTKSATIRVTPLRGTASRCLYCRLDAIVRVTTGMQRTNYCRYHATVAPDPIRNAIAAKMNQESQPVAHVESSDDTPTGSRV